MIHRIPTKTVPSPRIVEIAKVEQAANDSLPPAKTGWPAPALMQDDDRKLFRWFASKPDARQRVRESVRPLDVGGREGRDWPESHAATRACLLGLWNWACTPFRWMRSLDLGEWLAILMVVIAVCAWWGR